VTLEEGVIVFDNYFSLCTTDLFWLLTLDSVETRDCSP
jgi:hypothetical protein